MRVLIGKVSEIREGIFYRKNQQEDTLLSVGDEIYNELKECIPDTFEMVVIASNAQWQEYGDDDVIYLPLPLKAYDLVDTVSDLLTDIHRKLKQEKEKPDKRSADEQGVINQAKSLLIEKNGMTEEEAHRYLQKRSMDNGTNMVETAQMILTLLFDET